MAKVSGLMAAGKIGEADPRVVAAMPEIKAPKQSGLVSARTEPVAPATDAPAQPVAIATSQPADTVCEIPIEHICRSPFQVRAMGDDAYIESLMESIAASSVISPIVVRRLSVDKSSNFELFEFVAGEHRAQACKRLGHQTIKAVVRTLTDKEAALALAADNSVRKNLDDFDRYQHALMLKQNGFCRTDAEVSVTLGMTKSHVSMLAAFGALPDEAQAILRANPGSLGVANAYQLRDLIASSPALVTQALAAVAKGNLKQSGIRAWIGNQTRLHAGTTERRTIKLERPGKPTVSLILLATEVVIRSDALDTAKLLELVEANLDKLTKMH